MCTEDKLNQWCIEFGKLFFNLIKTINLMRTDRLTNGKSIMENLIYCLAFRCVRFDIGISKKRELCVIPDVPIILPCLSTVLSIILP